MKKSVTNGSVAIFLKNKTAQKRGGNRYDTNIF